MDDSETNISDALEYTGNLFNEGVIKHIVLISDGRDSDLRDADTLTRTANSLALKDIRTDYNRKRNYEHRQKRNGYKQQPGVSEVDTAHNNTPPSRRHIDGLRLTEVGVYTITVRSGGTEKVYNIYSAFPEEERFTTVQETSLKITGEASAQKRDIESKHRFAVFVRIGSRKHNGRSFAGHKGGKIAEP